MQREYDLNKMTKEEEIMRILVGCDCFFTWLTSCHGSSQKGFHDHKHWLCQFLICLEVLLRYC
jgi:hypothetical protein